MLGKPFMTCFKYQVYLYLYGEGTIYVWIILLNFNNKK